MAESKRVKDDLNKASECPHSMSVDEVFDLFFTSKNGLTEKQAKSRLKLYGSNILPESQRISIALLVLKQFKSWLVIILIVAALISFATNQLIDAWVIIIVVIINAFIGFLQEYRAEKAIAALQRMIVMHATVVRNGELKTIRSTALVPGDVLVLNEGDSVPADGRIFDCNNLRTNEASLTGESVPNVKHSAAMPNETPLADRESMVYKGTFVVGGYAKVIVTATGVKSVIGGISKSLGEIRERRTNFMQKTDVLARQMAFVAIISSFSIFAIGYFLRDFHLNEILLTSIAALVAAVPEGLPAVISIVLAIGANRMSRRKAVVREFTATETLGAVTAILTDKTGTLTHNTLTVRHVFMPEQSEYTVSGEGWLPFGNFYLGDTIVNLDHCGDLRKLLKVAAISNNSEVKSTTDTGKPELIGDPTEGALLVLARKGGMESDEYIDNRIDDLPFNADIKLRGSLYSSEDRNFLAIAGAPEKLLSRSTSTVINGREVPLSKHNINEIQGKITAWSDKALRVIALAYKRQETTSIDINQFDDLVFLGIVGMIDPPRKDTKISVQKCKRAGIRVIMVTGDHINTAVAIAKASGIIEDNTSSSVVALTEQQLERLSEQEFDKALDEISVFARLTPQMKLKIADRLQRKGHLIAMTGDGVNDAPALKKADVGVSMGIIGTDVARESSDVVLSDDNFSTIANAIEEGRIVFNNVRQSGFFLITTNIAESVTLFLAIFIGLPIPLTATQILWLNLVTDSSLALALAAESGHGDIMSLKPASKTEQILNKKIIPFLVINVTIMSVLAMIAFNHYLEDLQLARTGVFIIMVFTQLFNVFNLRSIEASVFSIGFFSNRYINVAVIVSIFLLIIVIDMPWLSNIFGFRPMPWMDCFVLFLASSLVLWAGECYKIVKQSLKIHPSA